MSDIKARYSGPSLTGVDLNVVLDSGEIRNVHIPYGGELPNEVGGSRVSATFRDSLLTQGDNFSKVTRDESKSKAADAAKDGDS